MPQDKQTTLGVFKSMLRTLEVESSDKFSILHDVETIQSGPTKLFGKRLCSSKKILCFRMNFTSEIGIWKSNYFHSIDVFGRTPTPIARITCNNIDLVGLLPHLSHVLHSPKLATLLALPHSSEVSQDESKRISKMLNLTVSKLLKGPVTRETFTSSVGTLDDYEFLLSHYSDTIKVSSIGIEVDANAPKPLTTEYLLEQVPTVSISQGIPEKYYPMRLEKMFAGESTTEKHLKGVKAIIDKVLHGSSRMLILSGSIDTDADKVKAMISDSVGSAGFSLIENVFDADKLFAAMSDNRTGVLFIKNRGLSLADQTVRTLLSKANNGGEERRITFKGTEDEKEASILYSGKIVILTDTPIVSMAKFGYDDKYVMSNIGISDGDEINDYTSMLKEMDIYGLSPRDKIVCGTIVRKKKTPTLRKLCRIADFARSGVKRWEHYATQYV